MLRKTLAALAVLMTLAAMTVTVNEASAQLFARRYYSPYYSGYVQPTYSYTTSYWGYPAYTTYSNYYYPQTYSYPTYYTPSYYTPTYYTPSTSYYYPSTSYITPASYIGTSYYYTPSGYYMAPVYWR
jgi:hypothetical protein